MDDNAGRDQHALHFERSQQKTGIRSLEKILETSKDEHLSFHLSRRDRLYLAVTLASSILQLDGTSWLKRIWKSGDILFLLEEDQHSKVPCIDVTNPYVSWNLFPEDVEPDQTAKVAQRVPCDLLAVLGITLTELCFGRKISQMRSEEDVDPSRSEVMTDFNTAIRLLHHVYKESGGKYGDVVRRCLKCPPDVREASLDNEEFQAAVFDLIVMPLKEDFEVFTGGSIS